MKTFILFLTIVDIFLIILLKLSRKEQSIAISTTVMEKEKIFNKILKKYY